MMGEVKERKAKPRSALAQLEDAPPTLERDVLYPPSAQPALGGRRPWG